MEPVPKLARVFEQAHVLTLLTVVGNVPHLPSLYIF
jgi:hypothetical protein